MFELCVEREFSASHAIMIGGTHESAHSHNWRISVVIGGMDLDQEGVLYDFHRLESHLDAVIRPFRNCDFNSTPPFDRINPTAELIVKHIAESLSHILPEQISHIRVTTTEAPGCQASYELNRA